MQNTITKENILSIVTAGFQNRFQNLSPFQFEKLVQLLLDDYYQEAQLTKKGGDFGGDVICYDSERNKIVVQCKRYKKGNNVGNKYIDNVISSKIYYEADKGLIVTTSSFTKSAEEIASKADIELWDWNNLVEVLSNTLNSGEPLAKLLQSNEINKLSSIDSFIESNISSIEQSEIVQNNRNTNRTGNFIKFEIINKTPEIIEVDLGTPLLLKNQQQYDIDNWWSGYFTGGTILPNATVTSGVIIDAEKVGELNFSNTKLFVEFLCRQKNSETEFRDFLEIDRNTEIDIYNPYIESGDEKKTIPVTEKSNSEIKKSKSELLDHNSDETRISNPKKIHSPNNRHYDPAKAFIITIVVFILIISISLLLLN